jgi:tripartite-type tricarboxylate transporter receptor subunit TctC
MRRFILSKVAKSIALLAGIASVGMLNAQSKWEPSKTVEFVVPAGTGGGADQMARAFQGIVAKHKLMKQPMVVVNKGGGAGAEGFMDVQSAKGDPHKIIISLSNTFTTPYASGVPFSWKNLTPVSMLALDQFILWVNAETPYKTAGEYLTAAKAAGGRFKMGGTGSKQEDQIITAEIEKLNNVKFTYIPYKGGGEVAVQLVGKHVDSTVNNPIEAVAQWRAGQLRPLCLMDGKRSSYTAKVTNTMAWSDIPTCKEQGVNFEYLMLRGLFMPGGVSNDQRDYYVDLVKKVAATDDWKDLMEKGAFNTTMLTGQAYSDWVAREDKRHYDLMKEVGFLAPGK